MTRNARGCASARALPAAPPGHGAPGEPQSPPNQGITDTLCLPSPCVSPSPCVFPVHMSPQLTEGQVEGNALLSSAAQMPQSWCLLPRSQITSAAEVTQIK